MYNTLHGSRDQNNIKSDLLLSHLVAYLVARTMDIGPAAAAAQHNARTLSPDPQSTGAAITMDGGVADTTRGNTLGRFSAKRGEIEKAPY